MSKSISRKKVNEFSKKWANGAKIKIFYSGIVNTFSKSEGYSLDVKGDFLVVHDPDGDLFDRYDLKMAEVYVYEGLSDEKN